jgi:predicted ATP-dependent endonuclease of OLD family
MQSDSTIRSLGYIQFKTHSVHISHDLDLDQYVCFKSSDSRCDIETFNDSEAAVDYILEPLPSLVYYIDWGPNSEE